VGILFYRESKDISTKDKITKRQNHQKTKSPKDKITKRQNHQKTKSPKDKINKHKHYSDLIMFCLHFIA